MGYIFLIVALVFNASANILMKLGARAIESGPDLSALAPIDKILALATNWYLMLGLVLFASNVLFYIVALKRINLSLAYPIMTSGGFLIISLYSVYYLKEHLGIMQIVGIVMIAGGITLLAYNIE
jgi:multidrug transporter EmrE-like cation transporter